MNIERRLTKLEHSRNSDKLVLKITDEYGDDGPSVVLVGEPGKFQRLERKPGEDTAQFERRVDQVAGQMQAPLTRTNSWVVAKTGRFRNRPLTIF